MSASTTIHAPRRALAREHRILPVWWGYGCLALCLLAYLGFELVRPAGSMSTWIDGWGVDAGTAGGSTQAS